MLLTEYDYETDIEVQREEAASIAMQKGLAKGLEQGAYNKAIETARNLKNKGIDFNIISECTGLSIEQIESL